ncbi:hypothetical protein [Streptomyces coerulescens]|uniref:Uncharacterized protein n=1 Tax=Streptomyces coerulescens TaxID=29304 RepID=A0ABW0D0Y8_STRCD
MTQSGRSEEPSARPAREGIVLPSDGGEPLLPGMTGGQGGGPTPVPATPPAAPAPSAPPGGQAWGTPWGPEQNPPAQAAAPGQAWGAQPGQSWGRPEQQPSQVPQQDHQASQLPQQEHQAYQLPQQDHQASRLPQQEHQAYQLPQQDYQAYQLPQHDQSYPSPSPAPWGAAPEARGGIPSQPMPQDDALYGGGAQGPAAGAPSYGQGAVAGGSPMPAPQPAYGQGGAPLPPEGQHRQGQHGQGGALPPAAPVGAGGFDEGATQYIPPVAAAPMSADDQATSFLPPVAAPAADEGATQLIPPVGPGALPPEVSSEHTQVLGRARQGGGAGPMPPVSGSDADATQYIPPVAGGPGGGERQPLSDFDNLFRSESAGQGQAGATQQLPRFQQPQPQRNPHEPAFFPPGGHDVGDDGGGPGGRNRSRVPLIAVVGVGIAALGIGAGALLAGGGGDDDKGDDNQPVSATAPATEDSASPSADPAEQQAVALDKLLADSGDSRTSVINAVDAVKSCDNLGKAAQDLRDAARQRNQLVTDLSKLSVDQLPNHAALTAALNKAWQASASADNHYAAWADQVSGNKKLCKKGQARSTGQTQAGNRASGTASEQKKTAAGLWNSIAEKYGLTERQPTQL